MPSIGVSLQVWNYFLASFDNHKYCLGRSRYNVQGARAPQIESIPQQSNNLGSGRNKSGGAGKKKARDCYVIRGELTINFTKLTRIQISNLLWVLFDV